MKTWFYKKKKNQNLALTRFEAIDLLIKVNDLLHDNRIGAAMEAIGMEPDVFSAEVTMDELADAFRVRLADLAKYAGVKL